MKGLFIPDITAEMFRNGCLEGIEALMAEGEIYDIEYDPSAQRWMPFKEQFPKDGQRVLVQMENGYTELIDFSAYGLTSHLVAWMPLPAPYNGGEQNEAD